jgi:hypothetical protein
MISEKELAKLLARNDKDDADWAQNLAKLKRLAGRKRLKANTTAALQVALEGAKESAWELTKDDISSFLKPVFEEAYVDFLLAAGFKMVWNIAKKQKEPMLLGFNFCQALKYLTHGIPNSKVDTMVVQVCRELVVGSKLEEADVYMADGKLMDYLSEHDEENIAMLENAGHIRTEVAGILLSENHLHRNVKINAIPIAKILCAEEMHNVFDKDFNLSPDGYRWLWNKIRTLCLEKFNREFEAKIHERAPLYSFCPPKVKNLYTPKRQSTTRSAFKHVVRRQVMDENGVYKEVSVTALPTKHTVERIREKLSERPKQEIR